MATPPEELPRPAPTQTEAEKDELFLRHFVVCSAAKQAIDDANSAYRTALKAAQKEAPDAECIPTMIALKRADATKVRQKFDAEQRCRRRLGLPTGPQADLFAAAAADDDPKRRAKSEAIDVAAGTVATRGYHAGHGGHLRADNPHAPGSMAYQEWDTAWVQGVADRKEEQGGEPAAPAPASSAAAAGPFSVSA